MTATPHPQDKFTFGLWTVGWQGVDLFGGRGPAAAGPGRGRAPAGRARALRRHASTTTTWCPTTPRRDADARRGSATALAETGLVVPMATTNLFSAPGVQGRRRSPPTTATCAGYALRQDDAQHRPGRRAGRRRPTSAGAAARAPRAARQQGRARPRSTATRRRSTCSARYVREQGYDIRFALEPKPNEPRGDILLPTIGHALAFIGELEHPEMVGLNPEVGHEEMAGLNFAHGIAQALWHGKLFHVDLNGQHGIRFDQDLRFGAGNLRGAFWTVDACWSRRAGLRRLPALRLQAAAHRGRSRASGPRPRGCMRNYLILREQGGARSVPTPRCRRRSTAARVAELATAHAGRRRDRSTTCARATVRRRGARWPSGACTSRRSTSSPWSTCSAPADPVHRPGGTR